MTQHNHRALYISALLTPLLAATLMGCVAGEEASTDGTPGETVEVRFVAETGWRSSHLSVSKLDVWVAEVVFDADTDERSISMTEPQNRKVDALSGAATSDVVGITLTEGTYYSPYLGVELWDDGSEPALVLEGTLDEVPIRLVFDSGEVFEAEAERLVVAEGASTSITFTLQPQSWFRGIDGSALTVGGDGVAEISETSNPSVFDRVADALDRTTDGRFPGGSGQEPVDTGW